MIVNISYLCDDFLIGLSRVYYHRHCNGNFIYPAILYDRESCYQTSSNSYERQKHADTLDCDYCYLARIKALGHFEVQNRIHIKDALENSSKQSPDAGERGLMTKSSSWGDLDGWLCFDAFNCNAFTINSPAILVTAAITKKVSKLTINFQ
jgi:hypothetical protein